MGNTQSAVLIMVVALSAAPAWSQARNVILFTADGAGVSTLNAASLYSYEKPQALYVQSMPYMALTDTSTATKWVTDESAAATAWATGVKTANGILSESASAQPGVRAGKRLKTILEYAEEHGLSTGIITDNEQAGVAVAAVAAFYAHSHTPQTSTAGETFLQLLDMKAGDGVDVVIGPGRKLITEQLAKAGHNIAAEAKAKGYAYVESAQAISTLGASTQRIIALLDKKDFDFTEAVQQAVAHLRKNPKGFILIVNSNCNLSDAEEALDSLVALDKTVKEISEQNKQDTLILFTAGHGVNMRLKGEDLVETKRKRGPEVRGVLEVISHQTAHTAEEVPLLAAGPGADRVGGFVPNTEVFKYMMAELGWKQ